MPKQNGGCKTKDPATLEDRRALCNTCTESLKLTLPVLVDSMDDHACLSYAAWPERLFALDESNAITFRGEWGPGGFKPEDLARFLKEDLATRKK